MSNQTFVLEKLSQTLTAGQNWPLNIAGDTFRVVTAFWPVSLTVMRGGRVIGTVSNMLAGDYIKDIQFDEVIVNSAIAQSVTIMIASGGAGSDRITGSVEVVDGGKNRSLAGNVFWGFGAVGAVTGMFSMVQIWNPTGNTNRLLVSQLTYASPSAGAIANLTKCTAALVGNASPVMNKFLGGGAPTAQIWSLGAAAKPADHVAFSDLYMPTGQNAVLKPTEPFVIMPGYGLSIDMVYTAQTLSADFEFYEEPF